MKKQQFTVSTCVCPNCGLRFPIPRKKSKAKLQSLMIIRRIHLNIVLRKKQMEIVHHL